MLYRTNRDSDKVEKQIKIIYRLTTIALVALILIQGYWLFNQYRYTLQKYEDELFQKTISVIAIDTDLRRKLQDSNLQTMTQWQMNVLQNQTAISTPQTEWIIGIYIIDKNKIDTKDSISLQTIDSLSTLDIGIKKHSFIIKEPDRQSDVYDAIEQFKTNELCPFQTERFDSLLHGHGLKALSVRIDNSDSIIWNPDIIRHTSILNPVMEVVYPFNILQKEQIKVTYQLRISPILGRMLESLICSIVLSLLLIFCLIYQTKTIFKQQRIEELRKSFIKTMIHELKRPLSTLKMCISFMKNDKMMQDNDLKGDILRNSQNELDNLSSYFSKLRDLTYSDIEKIPLNLSVFCVKDLAKECIEKQNRPADRNISIEAHFDDDTTTIMADKMHISNILCNLLENAVKYSEGDTCIYIDCRSIKDNYRIEVSDNGFGISSSESPYVFDKYFRSESATAKNIPGIGLGLSYVKLLISAHKGKVFLESILGVGSRFTIEIPKRQ